MADRRVITDINQTMALSRVIGFLQAERNLLTYRPGHEDTIALIDARLDDLFAAFPKIAHLKGERP